MKRLYSTGLAASVAWLGLLAPAPAIAQGAATGNQPQEDQARRDASADGADGIAEVVVTANRRAENLQRIPVSISALTGADLEARGISSAVSLSGVVPNVRVNSPFSETQPNFTIRGIGVANEFNPNAQSPIGVYFDEVYQGFRSNHGAALFDLERIEVLKGPQGTLYGRNTTGGAINMITRRPDLSGSNGYLSVGYGNYDRFTVAGAAEVTLIDDRLGARVAFTRLVRDGYIDNVTSRYGFQNAFVGDRDFDSADTWAGRLTIRARPTDTLDLTFRGYYSDQTPIGSSGVVVQLGPGGSDIAGLALPGIGRREAAVTNQGRFVSRAWGLSLRADWTVGDVVVTALSGYDDGYLDQAFDFDGTPSLIGEWRPNTANFASFSQDVHATYDGGGFKLIGGAYFGWQEVSVRNNYFYLGFLNGFAGPGQFNPGGLFVNPALVPPTAIDAQQELTQTQHTYAAYLEAEFRLADRLRLTIGGRLTRERVTLTNFSSLLRDSSRNPVLYPYASGTDLLPGLPVLTGILPNLREGVTKPTGRVILSYELSSDDMIYGSFSRGYRSGSYNGQSIVPIPNFVPPEFVDAWEAGFKSRFLDNRLQINGAVFYNRYSGQQVQEIQNGASFLRSLDGRMYGFEVEVVARPHPRFRLQAALGYLNTRYNDGQFLAPGDPAATDPRGIPLGGNAFPFAPRWTASLSPQFTVAEIGTGAVILGADIQYASRQFFDPFNDRQAAGPLRNGQDAYALVDASIRYENDRYSVSLWAKNIFNRYYFVYGLNIESFGLDFFTPGPPRTFGVEARVRF